jgi:hypothetical protein
MSLTAEERETTVTYSAADTHALVYSSIRSDVTKLMGNLAFECIEEGSHDGSAFVRGMLPKKLVSFRNGKFSISQPKVKAETVKADGRNPYDHARKCAHVKGSGERCGMIAKKDSDFCRWHPQD